MGAQISKTAGKEEVAAEKPAEGAAVAAKSNGQENGHAKTNGDASPAAEEANKADVQANGSSPTEEAPKEEAEGEKVEAAENGEKDPAATNGEASAKSEADGTPTTSEDGKQKKKRFSLKKPSFKLSGFSFKKTKKDSEEGAEGGAEAPAEGEKKDEEAAAAADEAKPEEPAGEAAKDAPAEEPKAEEAKEEAAEEKPSEVSPAEPETAASPEAPATAE